MTANRDSFPSEKLFELLTSLRDSDGFNIGTNQILTIESLLLRLKAAGIDPCNLQRLGGFIGPIICSSPDEQETFAYRYRAWMQAVQSVTASPTGMAREVDASGASMLSQWGPPIIQATLLTTIAGSLLFFGTRLVLQSEFLRQQFIWVAIMFLIVCGIVYWIAGRISALQYLKRKGSLLPPTVASLFADTSTNYENNAAILRTYARSVYKRQEVETHELDTHATVIAVARNAGTFTPVFKRRGIVPEYLALIEKAARDDLQAYLAHRLVQKFRAERVNIDSYYFQSEPLKLASADRQNCSRSLDELTGECEGYRLWLMSDGSSLINQTSGNLSRWVRVFENWPQRSLLTPEPQWLWAQRETTIRNSGFHIERLNARGLAASFDPKLATSSKSEDQLLIPGPLHDDVRYWISDAPGDAAKLRSVLLWLRRYLSAEEFFLFAACAVFPELPCAMTVYLSNELTHKGKSLDTSVDLFKLARLPWFRFGRMPDWVRRILLQQLSREQAKQTRSALFRLLGSSISQDRGDVQLSIAIDNSRQLQRLWRTIASIWARSSSESHPIRDQLFVTWMDNRLAVRVPRAISKWLANLASDLRNAGRKSESPLTPYRFLDSVDDKDWGNSKDFIYLKFKYFFERVLGICLLVLLLPVIAVLWLAVRATSPGPGFYTQNRVGLDGKVFRVVKLRSMRTDVEVSGKIAWNIKADSRITPLGKILRKLHLDELPQLWNVACGDMSLVGPRPERPEITQRLEQLIPNYNRRHRVKPGITGLAQVNLEPDFNINLTRKKQILDLRYIEKANLLLDLRLLFATSLRVIGIPGVVAMKIARLQQQIDTHELEAVGYQFNATEEELWNPSKEVKKD